MTMDTAFQAPPEVRFARSQEQVDFALNLRQLIDKSGLPLSEVAKKVGVRPCSLTDYITGRSVPKLDTSMRIAKLFGVSLDSLAHGTLIADAPEDSENPVPVEVSVNDVARALGLEYKSADRLAAMQADENWASVFDTLLSSPEYLEFFGALNQALHYASGDIVYSDSDAQTHKVTMEHLWKQAGVEFTKGRRVEVTAESINYLRSQGYTVLPYKDSADYYVGKAADTLKTIFAHECDRLSSECTADTTNQKS